MRLFIAINFNDDTHKELLFLRGALRTRSERGNFTAADNMQLTLAFLGECDENQTAAAKSAMESIDFDPFVLYFECVGRYRRGGGDLWWVGVRENESLQNLHRELVGKLSAVGFSLDKRGYSPHITIGREVVTDLVPWNTSPFSEVIYKIDLMQSERINGKLIYTPKHTRESTVYTKQQQQFL